MLKNAAVKILIFISAVAIMAAALVLSSLIPKSAIRENMLGSAQYMASKDMYELTAPDVIGSCTDHYSDSILLNIIYGIDSTHPAVSSVKASYYHEGTLEENQNLLEAVSNDIEPNRQYLRYWHGSMILLRPLLTVLPVQKIYMLFAAVIAALAIWLIVRAVRSGNMLLAAGIAVSAVMVRIWFVPLSLEYTWCCIITLAAGIAMFSIAGRWDTKKLTSFFLAVGMVTNYFDFLTTETVTLTVPLLILIRIYRKGGTDMKKTIAVSAGSAVSWLAGYAFMWMAKWALASAVLGENVMPYVTGHIANRLGTDMNSFRYYLGAVTRNFGCLFPLGHGLIGMAGMAAILLLGLYFAYVYRKPGRDIKAMALYFAVALVPVVRYLVLHNHSYIHFFFTYRALAGTVLATVLMIGELTGAEDGTED